jgi:hypothetical protein
VESTVEIKSNASIQVKDKPEKAYTLIVIYGQYRTFDMTCHGIFHHIVRMNQPARIILTFDDRVVNFDAEAAHCMTPYENHIYVLSGEITEKLPHVIAKEFALVDRAMKWVDAHQETLPKFEYMLKVRSDNFVQVDISVAASYAINSYFFHHFIDFETKMQQIYQTNYHRQATSEDLIWAWVMTGGIPRFIKPMLITPSPSPWCLINATTWNRNIRGFTYQQMTTIPRSNYYQYSAAMQHRIQEIHQKFSIVYLIGSTWIHYGRYDQIRKISEMVLNSFGKLHWNVSRDYKFESELYSWPVDPPFDQMKINFYPGKWTDITESQLRLSHWNYGWNLIDIVNIPDYMNSFVNHPNASLLNDIGRDDLAVWLLRTCDRHPNRGECRSHASSLRGGKGGGRL